MIRIKAAGLITVLFTTLAGGGGAVPQTSEFIIGGDFLGGVVMPHNGARLSPGFLKTLDSAGFTHLFLLVDTNLVNEANQEITNAHALGMGIILGHCEGTPDQDYWVHTRGNRWKFHPEDTIQFPRLGQYVGKKINDAQSGADAEATMYSLDTLRDAWSVESSQPGTLVDTLDMRPELQPSHTRTLYARIRLRIRNTMTDPASDILRVIMHDSGFPSPGIDVTVRGNTLKRTPQTNGAGVQLASDNTYGEVYLGSWHHNDRPIFVKIDYLGNADVAVDYIAFDDSLAHALFQGDHDWSIDQRRTNFHANAGLYGLKGADEPGLSQWPLVGYIHQRHDQPAGQVNTASWLMHTWRNQSLRYALEAKHEQLAIDVYPIRANPARNTLNTEGGQADFQAMMHNEAIDVLRRVSTMWRDTLRMDRPLWVMMQNHEIRPLGANPWYREPANDELLLQAQLALAYGAKGVWHFPVGTADTTDQGVALFDNPYRDSAFSKSRPVRRINNYGENKWEALCAINRMLGTLGPLMVGMRWRNTYSCELDGHLASLLSTLHCNGIAVLDSLKTSTASGGEDADGSRYCEVGVFDNPAGRDTTEYVHIVNRRVGPNGKRIVKLSLRHDDVDVWVERVPGIRVDVIHDSAQQNQTHVLDTVMVDLESGDGALLCIDSASSTRSRVIADSGFVHTGATLELKQGATLTIGRDAVLTVQGTVLLGETASIVLDGGTVRCLDSGRIVVASKHGVRGSGVMIDMDMQIPDSLTIAWGDTIEFRGNTRLSCSGTINRMFVDGVLPFTQSGSTVMFPNCLTDILVSGTLDVHQGVTLQNVPRITGYSGSQLLSHGVETSQTRWQFRTIGACNAYGLLDARHTVFEGRPDSNNVWTGILAAYEDAELHLDTCTVTDVQVANPAYSCAAVHLFGAACPGNRIRGSHIQRTVDSIYGRVGYGVFLQPGYDGQGQVLHSRVRVSCSRIDSAWWVGACSVNGDMEIAMTQIHGNRVGVSVTTGSNGVLYGSCIENAIQGCGVHVSASMMKFGYNDPITPGKNCVMQNDSAQIAIDDAGYVYFGIENNSSQNNIYHADSTVRRVTMSPTAQESALECTWWGEAPDSSAGLFSFAKSENFFGLSALPPNRLLYGPAMDNPQLTSCAIVCEETDPLMQVFRKRATLQPYATNLWQLPLYAQTGNFHEVYRMLGQFVTSSLRSDAAALAAEFALLMENTHLRIHADSAATSFQRLIGFLAAIDGSSRPAATRASILSVRARAAMLCGDIATAESLTSQLLTLYSGSSAAQKFPIHRLLMATMGDDSAVVNTRTNDILSGTFTDLERSQAQHIRNGYHRVLPRPFIRKARGEWQRSSDRSTDPDALDCTAYPNPFNSSTTIAWTMHERDHALLRVYDALGREVMRPTDAVLEMGRHSIELHGRDLAPGLYFVHVLTSTKKAVLRVLLEPVPGNR